MGPVKLSDFFLPVDLALFVKLCWDCQDFYGTFLKEKLEDINVVVDEWAQIEGQAPSDKTRKIRLQFKCFNKSSNKYELNKISNIYIYI